MAIRLHTAVGDEIREIEKTDPIQAAEMRMESVEYHNEVRGFYDEEYDPADQDEGHPEEEPECDEYEGDGEDGDVAQGHYDDDPQEDMGWDGGLED
jgi:hypothetical protein